MTVFDDFRKFMKQPDTPVKDRKYDDTLQSWK